MPTATRLNTAIAGMIELLIVNMDPNRIVTVAPLVDVRVVSQVEEQGGQPEPGAAHDAGGQVSPARAADADHVHDLRRDHAGAREPPPAD